MVKAEVFRMSGLVRIHFGKNSNTRSVSKKGSLRISLNHKRGSRRKIYKTIGLRFFLAYPFLAVFFLLSSILYFHYAHIPSLNATLLEHFPKKEKVHLYVDVIFTSNFQRIDTSHSEVLEAKKELLSLVAPEYSHKWSTYQPRPNYRATAKILHLQFKRLGTFNQKEKRATDLAETLDEKRFLSELEKHYQRKEIVLTSQDDLSETSVLGKQASLELTIPPLYYASNPGSRDEKDYLKSRGLVGRGKIEKILHLSEPVFYYKWIRLLEDWREKKFKSFKAYYSSQEYGLLLAMILGEEEYLLPKIKSSFQYLGLSHLLVASGGNVALVALLCQHLLRKVFSKKVQELLLILCFFLYACLSHWEPSITRALFACLIAILLQAFSYLQNPLQIQSLATCLVLVFFPHYVNHLGFWMSTSLSFYLATCQIHPLCGKFPSDWKKEGLWKRGKKKFVHVLLTYLGVQILLLPFTSYFHARVSVYSVLFNLFLLPLYSSIIYTGLLVFLATSLTLNFFSFFLLPLVYLNRILIKSLLFLTQNPYWLDGKHIFYSDFLFLFPPFIVAFLLYLRWDVRFFYKKKSLVVCAVLLLSSYVIFPLISHSKEASLVFVDVGQGDAVFYKNAKQQAFCFDVGGAEKASQLEKVLNYYAIHQVEVLISHEHLDHYGGLAYLAKKARIKNLHLLLFPERVKEVRRKLLDLEKKEHLSHMKEASLLLRALYPKLMLLADAYKIPIKLYFYQEPSRSPKLSLYSQWSGASIYKENLSLKQKKEKNAEQEKILTWLKELHLSLRSTKELEEVGLQIYGPNQIKQEDENKNSLWIALTWKLPTQDRLDFILLGDAGKKEEETFMQELSLFENEARHFIYKASHHGSKSSNGKKFLAILKPNLVYISAGKNNFYGHPHQETLTTLEELDIPYYRADQQGALLFRLENKYVLKKNYGNTEGKGKTSWEKLKFR